MNKNFTFKTDEGYEFSVKNQKIDPKHKASGLCYDPTCQNPKILIDSSLTPRRELSVSIEEFAHAFFFEKSEKKVRKFAAILSKYLYSRGWRKTL
jgi:hypothetical protein